MCCIFDRLCPLTDEDAAKLRVEVASLNTPEAIEAKIRSQKTTEKCLKVCLAIMGSAIFIIGLLSALGHMNATIGGWCAAGLALPVVIGAPLSLAGWAPPVKLP